MSMLWVLTWRQLSMSIGSERILLGQDVGDPVSVPGLHGGQRGQRNRSTCWDPWCWRAAAARSP